MFRIDQAVDAAFDIRLSLFQLQAAHMQLFSADGKNTADGHEQNFVLIKACLLYTSPSPRDRTRSRMPSSA